MAGLVVVAAVAVVIAAAAAAVAVVAAAVVVVVVLHKGLAFNPGLGQSFICGKVLPQASTHYSFVEAELQPC